MDVQTTPTPTPTVPHAEFFPPPRGPRGPSRWVAMLVEERRQLVKFWPVIQNMVVQELRVRYQRSMLGFLWTLLNPILMMATLTLVFSQVFKWDKKDFVIYLFAGMVPWGFLSGGLNDCAYCIIFNEGLIRKIYLPKLVFPLSRVLINLTTFLLSMAALFLLLAPLGARFSLPMVLLVPVVVLFFAFVLGLGLIVATTNTFFRDCGHLVSVILQAWYFATPIMYRKSLLPADAQWRFWLNPAYPFIQMFQDIIKDGAWPQWHTFLVATAVAAVSLGVGYAAFKCNEDKFVFRL
jgi:ABC-2 type transport system permease protein/lipopolysaccharide transport system permease protein